MIKHNFLIMMLLFYGICIITVDISANDKIAVEVSCWDCKDEIGGKLDQDVKNKFKKSSIYRLTNQNEPRIILDIRTLSMNSYLSIYVVTWLSKVAGYYQPFYLTNTLGYCGRERVDDIAKEIIENNNRVKEDYKNTIIKIRGKYNTPH